MGANFHYPRNSDSKQRIRCRTVTPGKNSSAFTQRLPNTKTHTYRTKKGTTSEEYYSVRPNLSSDWPSDRSSDNAVGILTAPAPEMAPEAIPRPIVWHCILPLPCFTLPICLTYPHTKFLLIALGSSRKLRWVCAYESSYSYPPNSDTTRG